MITVNCDSCKNNVPGDYFACEGCGDEIQYCKKCVKKIADREHYCPKHNEERLQKIAFGKTLQGYVLKFWGEIGVKATKSPYDETIKVDLFGKQLAVDFEPIMKGNPEELIAIKHKVTGLSSRDREFDVPIFNHEAAIKQVRQALVMSLRSQKSAATQGYNDIVARLSVEKNTLDERLHNINTLLEKIGPVSTSEAETEA